jgi:hypothetical protein
MGVMQGPGRFAAKQDLINPDHQCAGVEPFAHPRFEVACHMQLLVQPGLFKRGGIGAQLILCTAGAQGVKCGICCKHASLHCGVAAFDAAGI